MENHSLLELPPAIEIETNQVLKRVASAHRYLAELKGISGTIPNENILINTLTLQEAKDSSAIENIMTTHDEMYKAGLFSEHLSSSSAKEVQRYAEALRAGADLVKRNQLLTCRHIQSIQQILEGNNAGFRKIPGTNLKNPITGETVYIPPQDPETIIKLMNNLENYINDDTLSNVDPLVKMAVIHYQFESIHPFYDGNGRTGRIINLLYLILKGLLNIPVLYLSRYIIETKPDYYRLLQSVHNAGAWEEWIIYILNGVEITARQTITIVKDIKELMRDYKKIIRDQFHFYSQDLLNNLFHHPYTKIDFLIRDLKITRLTAAKYLENLASSGLLEKHKIGRSNYYINRPLYNLLSKPSKS